MRWCVEQAAAAVESILEKTGAFGGNAARVEAFLTDAATVAAWHGLPFTALCDLLDPDRRDFRTAVFASPIVGGREPDAEYLRARDYLLRDVGSLFFCAVRKWMRQGQAG